MEYAHVTMCFCALSIFCFNSVQSKVFSKSTKEISLFQQPDVVWNRDDTIPRHKRSPGGSDSASKERAQTVHSQNITLLSTKFALHGFSDNEAFVHWTGINNDTVFVLTRRREGDTVLASTLWRSTDYGETYMQVELPDTAAVTYIYKPSSNRTKTILCDIPNRRLYITQDTGATWEGVDLGFIPHRLLIHPTLGDWVLAYDLHRAKLHVSQDFGLTWSLLKARVTERFFWAVPGVDPSPYTVHMELQSAMGPVSYHSCVAPSCNDTGFVNTIGTIDFYSLVVENMYIFVQKSVDDNTSLYVSYKRGPFKKAHFPSDLHAMDFNIIDTSDGDVFIVVDHEEDIANLYCSDITGQFYVTSMDNVVGIRYPGVFDIDLVKVEGFRGVYIANKFMKPRNGGGALAQKTFITYNKGGNWRELTAPAEHMSLCDDKEACSLHLHIGNTNKFFRIPLAISTPEAPGLLVAHGIVGDYLNFASHVYISRDAGVTWQPAPFVGNHHINIMDQGSVISAISADAHPTNRVHFSFSEGATWKTLNFSDVAMTVDNVLSEPGVRTLISSVFGHVDSDDGWTMVKLDFSSVITRQCDDGDFELWYPATDIKGAENSCLMGERLAYERRKQMSECYYGDNYYRPSSLVPCPCTREDYECDFGYEIDPDGDCIMSPEFDEHQLPAPTCVNGQYHKSSGYRKMSSNGCHGDDERYNSRLSDCPLFGPHGLEIIADKYIVPRNTNITFRLMQTSGSEAVTKYTWSFSDGTALNPVYGLENARVVVRSFLMNGLVNITVHAENGKGSAEATLRINIEDDIEGVLVEVPWGARTGIPSYFNATVLGFNNTLDNTLLHYAWIFEHKLADPLKQLTWQSEIQQTFPSSGEYRLTLEVFNSVSSVLYTQTLDVYDEITTIRLHFSEQINQYNSSSLHVRQALAEILCHNLAQILEVRRSRIIMSVQPYSPIVGDVSILPPKPRSNESETHKVVEMLITEAKQQYLAFPIFTSDDIVYITDAAILDLQSGHELSPKPTPQDPVVVTMAAPVSTKELHSEDNNLLVVYIAVPTIVVVTVTILILLHYKKKCSDIRHYSVVMHRNKMDTVFDADPCDDPELMVDRGPGSNRPEIDPELTILAESCNSASTIHLTEAC